MIKPKDKAISQQDEEAARAHRNMKWAAVGILIAVPLFVSALVYAIYVFILTKI